MSTDSLRTCVALWMAWTAATAAADAPMTKQPGRLTVAVYKDFAPFANDGQGIDVEVARALAGRVGLMAEVNEYPDADDIDGDLRNIVWRGHHLWKGRLADVMMHVPVDPAVMRKNEQVRIFGPYFRERLVVARDRARIPQLPTLQIFTTEKIGVQAESLEDRYLMTSFGGVLRGSVVHFGTIAEAAAALRRGEVAAVMGRQSLIEAALGADAGRFEIAAAPAPGLATTGWELGVAVKSDNPELATALETAMAGLVKDGTVERIFTNHGLTYRMPHETSSH